MNKNIKKLSHIYMNLSYIDKNIIKSEYMREYIKRRIM